MSKYINNPIQVEVEVSLPLLKGEKGETGETGTAGSDYVITDQDKQDIASLVEVDIDSVTSTMPMISGYDGSSEMHSGIHYIFETNPSTVEFSLESVEEDRSALFKLDFTTGSTAPNFIYPSGLTWDGGILAPQANTRYILYIENNLVRIVNISTYE